MPWMTLERPRIFDPETNSDPPQNGADRDGLFSEVNVVSGVGNGYEAHDLPCFLGEWHWG